MTDSIAINYLKVKSKVEQACFLSGRDVKDVNLVVVTKGHSADRINEVLKAGASILGENYPEETMRKIVEISPKFSPVWHMIGHLQSRKIKYMYPSFKLIHSLDSLELGFKLDRLYREKEEKIEVLIEVNIAEEETKFGFPVNAKSDREKLFSAIESLLNLKSLNVTGLMTMPPFAVFERQNESYYNSCRDLREEITLRFNLDHFKHLSMGTSVDYETAIRCGSTHVRVGEAIMGKRNYKNNQENLL